MGVEVSSNGCIFVTTKVDDTTYRQCLEPGDDLTGQPDEVVSAAEAAWTPEVLQAFSSLIPQDEPPAPPSTVTARQVRLWLVRHGVAVSDVTDALDAIEDAQVRQEAQIEWEYAPYIERSHPMVQAIATALDIDIDTAFAEAALL